MNLVSVKPPKFDCEIFADVSKGRGKAPEIKRIHAKILNEAESETDRSLSPESCELGFEYD
jgi:hypothetical protein